MRRLVLILTVCLMAVAGCKDKKTDNSTIITTDYEVPKPTAPISMGAVNDVQNVNWVDGRSYTVKIARHAVDSLPMVSNSNGQKYIDNSILLEVARADSSLFYSHRFTKASFANWLSPEYRDKAILQGMSFLQADSSALSFIAWLNYPDAGDDEAVELMLSIDPQRNISIQRFSYDDRDDLIEMDKQ